VPCLEELNRELKDFEKNDTSAESNKCLAFHAPQDVAKESILRNLGEKTKVLKVKDLSANLKNLEITVSILDLGEKNNPSSGWN
jgi:replication factor A1